MMYINNYIKKPHLLVEDEWRRLLIFWQIYSPFEAVLWDEHLKRILTNEQQVAFFVLDSVLEE